MSETTERRHGVESFFASVESSAEAAVDISVLSGFRFLNVRLDPRCERVVEAATQVLGQPIPLDSNTFTTGEHRVYWLGPDEWLIETSGEGAAALGSELAEALAGFHAASVASTRARCWRRVAPWTCILGSSARGDVRGQAWPRRPCCWAFSTTHQATRSSFPEVFQTICAAGSRMPRGRTAFDSRCSRKRSLRTER